MVGCPKEDRYFHSFLFAHSAMEPEAVLIVLDVCAPSQI